MKKELNVKKETNISTNYNSKTEDSEQASSKTLENQINNNPDDSSDYYKPLPSSKNLLDNLEILQYKSIKIKRLKFDNEYNFDQYKKPFNDILEKINIEYSLTKLLINYFSLMFKKELEQNKDTFWKANINQALIKLPESKKENNMNIKEGNIANINPISNNLFEDLKYEDLFIKDNISDSLLEKKTKYIRKIFNLKLYDKNKNLINKKRGRKSLKKKILHVHTALDDDNILRKIQVHFLTFLISFTNDYLNSIFPNMDKKTKSFLNFRHIDYKVKKTINHGSIEKLKKKTIGEILQMEASPKNKTCKRNINQIIYYKLCNQFPELQQIYFNKPFPEFFIEYYYNKNERFILLNGVKVNLSIKTQAFNALIQKNIEFSKKFRIMASCFYSKDDNENKNFGNKDDSKSKERQDNLLKKTFFLIE